MLLVACEREARVPARDSVVATSAVAAGSPSANATGPCPATGLWSLCAVRERLDRAGLAPRIDSSGATEPPLRPAGHLLRVGNSELELYVYPDAATLAFEASRLDRKKYVGYSEAMPMRPLPTLIHSVNLIAILHSRNEHQRERVSDAITAGPPQPSRP